MGEPPLLIFNRPTPKHRRARLGSREPLGEEVNKDWHFKNLGVNPMEVWRCLQYAADECNYLIVLRTADSSRLKSVQYAGAEPGPGVSHAVSKPECVKLKTLKEGPDPGFVGIPYAERNEADEHIDRINNDGGRGEGWHWKDRLNGYLHLFDRAGNRCHADLDLAGVYRKRGGGPHAPVRPEEYLPYLNGLMDKTGLHSVARLAPGTAITMRRYGVKTTSAFQHGGHNDWSERNNFAYGGGVNAGAPKGPFLVFEKGMGPRCLANDVDQLDLLNQIGQGDLYTRESKDEALARPRRPPYLLYPKMSAEEFDRL